jgi:hypothetical protein
LLGSVLLSATLAHADDGRPARRWYGWQIAISDLLAVSAVSGGIAKDDGPVTFAGLGLFVFAPALLHLAHGNSGYGAASFSVRLGAPVAGGALGYLAGGLAGRDDFANVRGLGWGLILGAVTAIGFSVFDIVVLAHERLPVRSVSVLPAATPTSVALTVQGAL